MDPIVYLLPHTDKEVLITTKKFQFDYNPSPRLIKYGYSSFDDQLNIHNLTENSYYRVGLNIDFTRDDDNSFAVQGKKFFKINTINQTFAEIWEILNLFNLLDDESIISSNISEIKQLVKLHDKKHHIVEGTKANNLIIHKYSDVELEENALVQLLIDDLPNFLSSQNTKGNMVIQIFGIQTQTMVEIIYYLSTLYTEAYIVKPSVSSNISNNKYLVLIGYHKKVKFEVPKHPKSSYLISIGVDDIPNLITTSIQCFNSQTQSLKYHSYYRIKSYLDTKVYEGASYQELIELQNDNIQKWLTIYSNPTDMKKLLDKNILDSQNRCKHFIEL